MARHNVIEIEDVSEPFCGCRRKHMVALIDKEPKISLEWNYKKNCGWGPEDFSYGSSVRAWWNCPLCLRTYKSVINNRTSGQRSGCPYCASKLVCEDNALVVFHPEIAAEFHPTKNGKKKAEHFTRASSKPVWWLCSKCHHSWYCAVADRTILDSGCPACYEARLEYARQHPNRHPTPQIILDENSTPSLWYQKPSSVNFVSLYQYSKKLAREWHPTKNGQVTSLDIAKGSDAIAWWKCRKGIDHVWQAAVCSRTRPGKLGGCPFCLNLQLSVTNCLATKAPKLAKEFHPTKNGKLTPRVVIAGGGKGKKYWWQCPKDKSHAWEAIIYNRMIGRGCPYCSHSLVSKENCLSKEFPYIAAQLHPTKNDGLTGYDIAAQSSIKRWWKCDKGPDHVWRATPANRTSRGSGCPACVGKQLSVTNCLTTLYPEKAKQWDKKRNGKLTPRQVSPHSKELAWWLCSEGHSWEQMIRKRVFSPVECWQCTGKTPPGVPAKQSSELLERLQKVARTAKGPKRTQPTQARGSAKSRRATD